MKKEIFRGKVISLFIERIKRSGNVFRERVYLPDSVNIFPFTENGKIRLIKEKRWENRNKPIIKIISGLVNKNEKPLNAAKRELMEEVGLKAVQWQKIFTIKQEGTVNQNRHYYIAKKLKRVARGEKNIIGFKDYTLNELLDFVLEERFGITTSAVIIKLYNKMFR